MLISGILLIAACVYKHSVRDSKDKKVKNTANKLLIAAGVLFGLDLFFLALSVFYRRDYSTTTLLFPIVSFFHKSGSRSISHKSSHMRFSHRSLHPQALADQPPITNVGGAAPRIQIKSVLGKKRGPQNGGAGSPNKRWRLDSKT